MRWPRVRFTVRRLLVAVAVIIVLIGLSSLSFVLISRHQHLSWYRNVEDHILRLADRRPEGVSPSRWAYCLHWTWNLHTNYGGYEYWDRSERTRFLGEFDRRLKGKVDLGTIDWIWDEYVEHTSGGRSYSQRYRPTDPENARAWFREGSYDLQTWLDELSHLPARR